MGTAPLGSFPTLETGIGHGECASINSSGMDGLLRSHRTLKPRWDRSLVLDSTLGR